MTNEVSANWRRVAQAFTRPVLTQLARTGSDQSLRRLLSCVVGGDADSAPLGSVLDTALEVLRKNYRCEYVYKAAIVDRIIFGRHSPRTASLHVELPVGRSIVDVAVFNGTSTAYEIKTEFDSDRRLSTQTLDYLRAFERVYVVTHPALVTRYSRILDERVGVLALSPRGSLTEVRAADGSGASIDKHTLFRLLRSHEYCQALEQMFGEQPPVPNGRRYGHYSKLWIDLSVEQAHKLTVTAMRARTTSPEMVDFMRQLPVSYRALGYATPLSSVQQARVLNILH